MNFPTAPNTVTCVITSALAPRSAEILLLKRGKNVATHPNCWSLLGGFIDVGKEGHRSAMVREIMEEIGLRVDEVDLDLIGVYRITNDPRYPEVFDTGFHLQQPLLPEFVPNEEIQEIKWFTYSDAIKNLKVFRHRDILMDWMLQQSRWRS